jgi:hypothetical protein
MSFLRVLNGRISHEIQKNLSASQILQLLHFLNERLPNQHTLLPLKAILLGIQSHQIIEHISNFIIEMFNVHLKEELRRKHPSEEWYEIYFLAMELSDSIARALYDSKVMKKAKKICKSLPVLFPVRPLTSTLMAVAMYSTTTRSRWRQEEKRKNKTHRLQTWEFGNHT